MFFLLLFILNFSDLIPSPPCCDFYYIPEKVKGGYGKCEVHSYIEESLFWKYEKIWEIYYYDSLGNRIEKVRLNNKNLIIQKNNYFYNNKGNLIENTYTDDMGHNIKFSFSYDAKDSLIEVTKHFLHNSQNEKQIYVYDDNGNQIEEITYNTDGHSSYHVKRIYDKRSNLIETNYINWDGTKSNRIVFEFDSNNNQIKSLNYGSSGSLFSHSKSWYNKKNELIETISYDIKNDITSHFKYSYKYNNDGVIIKKIMKDQLNGIELIYIFDDYGNNTGYLESYSFFSRGEKWTRKYDEFGNVTEFIFYKNPKDEQGSNTYKLVYIYSK
jgi:hypothetical protein